MSSVATTLSHLTDGFCLLEGAIHFLILSIVALLLRVATVERSGSAYSLRQCRPSPCTSRFGSFTKECDRIERANCSQK